jgi:hypothetical protein
MIASFRVQFFFPDGGPPESEVQKVEALSEKWLSICRALFEQHGPVFTQNMGSTLARFDIEVSGPMFQLKSDGHLCFTLAITSGGGTQQDFATSEWFRKLLINCVASAGAEMSDSASAAISDSVASASALVIDQLAEDVDNDQKHALIQLGYHLVGAYYGYMAEDAMRAKP